MVSSSDFLSLPMPITLLFAKSVKLCHGRLIDKLVSAWYYLDRGRTGEGGMSLLELEPKLYACAMDIEYRAAKRLGSVLYVGIGCKKQIPVRPVVSFGFAGALCMH